MCGIAGIIRRGPPGRPLERDVLQRMGTCLAHRGPDGQGIYVDPAQAVGLVHRRLSIIDLTDTASQPMSDASGRIWVSFNGEIYNHVELRAALVKEGYRFKTDHSDTEVLVHGYAHWGLDGLVQRLAGMFAFAIWDAASQDLWLVRDRIGIKPLYVTQTGDDLVFASEIKALLQHPDVRPRICPAAVSHYLSFWQTPAPLTMFDGIYKLQAGHWLRVPRSGALQMQRYWDVSTTASDRPDDIDRWPEAEQEKYYVDGVLNRLRHSVGEHMMSDVPYGAFLSGGVDSSTNVALMREFTDRPINTFTVGFSDHTHLNELDAARSVANFFGTKHHEVLVDQSMMWGYLEELIYSQDEPIADWVCIPLYFVSRLARERGMVVMQVGEGADEEFSGYDAYRMYLKAFNEHWKPFRRYCPPPVAGALASIADRLSWHYPQYANRLDMVSRAARNREVFWSNCHVFTDNVKNRLLCAGPAPAHDGGELASLVAPELWSSDTFDHVERLLETFDARHPGSDQLDRMIYLEFKLRLPELLLMRVDKITMSVSLEARVPYLDHRLVEFAASVPSRFKVRPNQGKYVLKQGVRGMVPDFVLDAKKKGFGAPMAEWLAPGPFLNHIQDRILRSRLQDEGIINYDVVKRLLALQQSGKVNLSMYIWGLYNLTAWYDRMIDQRGSIAAA
jgi:asparagine synthase (glutamine-hydrolysing)